MKCMRVVEKEATMGKRKLLAQGVTVEEALVKLHQVLDAFLKQPGNEIYGEVHLHDGSTDMGYKAPWGEYVNEYDLNANASFTPGGDESFIDIMFDQTGIAAVYAAQLPNGTLEFLLDFEAGVMPVGTSDMPLEAVAKNIHQKINEADEVKEEYAAEKQLAEEEGAEAAKEDAEEARHERRREREEF